MLRKRTKVLGVLLAAGLVLSGGGAAVWYQREHVPTEAAKETLRRTLKDPGSAVFRDVWFHSPTGATCGHVNAKNSMGGYVGFGRFFVTKDGEVTFQPRESTETGSTDDRLKALSEHIAFLEKMVAQCPEKAASS